MGYKYIAFDKDMTAIIKGVAIIFMIFLHCFGWESWYLPEYHIHLSHSSFLYKIMTAMQICVGMYVFMIGYGYAFAKNKNIEYSFKHTSRLLKIFWSILFLFVIPVSFKYTASKNAGWFFLNLFGIVEDLSWVSWFVALYIWSMILMPFLGRVLDRWRWIGMVVACIACYAGMTLIHQSVPDFNSRDWWHIIFVCLGWTPLIMFGYLTAKLKLVEKIKIPENGITLSAAIILIPIILILKSKYQSLMILNFDLIYAPVMILCILTIFTLIRNRVIKRIFTELGNMSVYMWFIHSIFFTICSSRIYQPLIMISDNLWIVSIWTILLSYLISIPLKRIIG